MRADEHAVEAFISRWAPSGGGERSNCQMFLAELCRLIGVEEPDPAVEDESRNAYVFERKVPARRRDAPTTANFIDLYKRGCFVLEAKQSRKRQKQLDELKQLGFDLPEMRSGSGRRDGQQWDTLMRNAREQAETYARRLPPDEGWPPFLVIVDVGHVIELYADFSLQGKHYAQFPDRQSFRIYLDDLRDEAVRERLRLIWTDPRTLDPTRRTAEVTREVAELLARLSASLETRMLRALPKDRRPEQLAVDRRAIAERVALFLMRCLFTMFAEDVGLLRRESFAALLREYRGMAAKLHFQLQNLWQEMNRGGFSTALRADLLTFNGGLFKDATALEITEDDLTLLTIAAERDWKDVEPAIFGTLLERALDPGERHRLGAHYTPRVYVERLVVATIIEPLTEDWRNVRTAAAQLMAAGEQKKARDTVQEFHRKLCAVRVLDPACGTGNFLYVAMELMKRLEGEVLETLMDLGERQYVAELEGHTVDPHQFLGLEINPRAVAIAELVLWIGYLQWHFRTRGRTMPAEPVLKNFANIREQDAIIEYDKQELLRDKRQRPITRWDGITYKLHPITGEKIPDEEARIELHTYLNPRPAKWPQADFIVGNPPFIRGNSMRQELGDGYAEACWSARKYVSGSADFVMHFWDKAAECVRKQNTRRFGLITTNSITQVFSRRIVERHLSAKNPLYVVMAIPDHPWARSPEAAAVRIAMTVCEKGHKDGTLKAVISEIGLNTDTPDIVLSDKLGKINPDLTVGTNASAAKALQSNEKIGVRGICLVGRHFMIPPSTAKSLKVGSRPGLRSRIRPYINGRDLTARTRNILAIDLYGLTHDEVSNQYPEVYQWILDRVKPERDQSKRKSYREKWWIFAEPRSELRDALRGLKRYVVTPMTAKHRIFLFLSSESLPDQGLVPIALDDAFYLGVLSSRIHLTWALAVGGTLEDRPRYNKTRCFDPYPFPGTPDNLKAHIRALGERLDAHRKAALENHRQLTMTGLYNVLEKVQAGDELTESDKDVYEAGLVGVLKQLHDELDAAVADAYGWPADLSDAEILERLVALNHARAAEEAEGNVRWLRPEFQAPAETAARKAKQIEADLFVGDGKARKPSLPAKLPDQVAAIRNTLADLDDIVTARQLAGYFTQGRRAERKVEDVLRTLVLLGQAEQVENAYFLSE